MPDANMAHWMQRFSNNALLARTAGAGAGEGAGEGVGDGAGGAE